MYNATGFALEEEEHPEAANKSIVDELVEAIEDMCPGDWDDSNPYEMHVEQGPNKNNTFMTDVAIVKNSQTIRMNYLESNGNSSEFAFVKEGDHWKLLHPLNQDGPGLSSILIMLKRIEGTSTLENKV